MQAQIAKEARLYLDYLREQRAGQARMQADIDAMFDSEADRVRLCAIGSILALLWVRLCAIGSILALLRVRLCVGMDVCD